MVEDFIKQVMQTIEGHGSALEVHATFKTRGFGQTKMFTVSNFSPGLPSTCRSVIQLIYKSSETVYDEAQPLKSITCAKPGSIRSWHQNDSYFLPLLNFEVAGLFGKAKRYHDHVVEHKGLQNKQAKKGHKNDYTGYLEYTPCTTEENQWARIVYDYVNDKVYFSASHYTPFTMDMDTDGFFPKISNVQLQASYKSGGASGLWNPFVYVRP